MPAQCPDCGRFLSKDLIRGLRAGPVPCPRCQASLAAERFAGSEILAEIAPPASVPSATSPQAPPPQASPPGTSPPPAPPPQERTAAATSAPVTVSVRPPDLPPTAVRPVEDRDVLEGWDLEPSGSEGLIAELTPERTGAIAIVLGSGVAGGLVGAAVGGRHRTPAAVIGTLLGAVLALLGTRVLWERTDL